MKYHFFISFLIYLLSVHPDLLVNCFKIMNVVSCFQNKIVLKLMALLRWEQIHFVSLLTCLYNRRAFHQIELTFCLSAAAEVYIAKMLPFPSAAQNRSHCPRTMMSLTSHTTKLYSQNESSQAVLLRDRMVLRSSPIERYHLCDLLCHLVRDALHSYGNSQSY